MYWKGEEVSVWEVKGRRSEIKLFVRGEEEGKRKTSLGDYEGRDED